MATIPDNGEAGWGDELREYLLVGHDAGGGHPTLAPIASPTFTGTPAVPVPGAGTDTTQIAPTSWVLDEINTAIADLDTFTSDTLSVDTSVDNVLQVEAPTTLFGHTYLFNNSTAGVVSTTTPTTLLNEALVLPDGIITPAISSPQTPGGMVDFDIRGVLTNNTGSSNGATVRINLAGTTVATIDLTGYASGASGRAFHVSGLLTFIVFAGQTSSGSFTYFVGPASASAGAASPFIGKFGGASLNLDGNWDITAEPTANSANLGVSITAAKLTVSNRP